MVVEGADRDGMDVAGAMGGGRTMSMRLTTAGDSLVGTFTDGRITGPMRARYLPAQAGTNFERRTGQVLVVQAEHLFDQCHGCDAATILDAAADPAGLHRTLLRADVVGTA